MTVTHQAGKVGRGDGMSGGDRWERQGDGIVVWQGRTKGRTAMVNDLDAKVTAVTVMTSRMDVPSREWAGPSFRVT